MSDTPDQVAPVGPPIVLSQISTVIGDAPEPSPMDMVVIGDAPEPSPTDIVSEAFGKWTHFLLCILTFLRVGV
jgi:hypothetical protein